MNRPDWLWNRLLRALPNDMMDDDSATFDPALAALVDDWTEDYAEATLITSLAGTGGGHHLPVLDLDIEHHYEPSSTAGHGHLFLNVPLSQLQMDELTDVLERLGIIQPGYRAAFEARGYTAVRKPGIVKPCQT